MKALLLADSTTAHCNQIQTHVWYENWRSGCAAFIALLTTSAVTANSIQSHVWFDNWVCCVYTLIDQIGANANPVEYHVWFQESVCCCVYNLIDQIGGGGEPSRYYCVYIYIYIYRWLEPPIIHGVEWMELVVVLRSMLHKLEEVGFPHEHICTGLTTCSFSSFESLSSRAKGKGPYYHWYHDGCVLGFWRGSDRWGWWLTLFNRNYEITNPEFNYF